jgi:N-acetylmuramoyl-L-alanine amidase CwlA
MYDITVNLIPGLPNVPYRYGAYEGVVAHCTDSANRSGGDTPTGERDYEARTFSSAFVHYFVGIEKGAVKIVQCAPTSSGAYGAGAKANSRFVHVELCMYDDPAMFTAAYDAYVWLLAKILYDRGLGVTPAASDGSGTLWAHDDVRRILGGTTHTDPIDYLEEHGISWDQHVANVQEAYTRMGKLTVFTDIEQGRWSEASIAAVCKAGIMEGFEDGTFRPTEPLTREQAAKIVNDLIYLITQK